MIISLAEQCPIFTKSSTLHFHRLMTTVSDGWHAVATPDPKRLEKLLPPETWGLYRELLQKSYASIPNMAAGLAKPHDCTSCEPSRLVEYFMKPVEVVVENATVDGDFIRLVATKLRRGLVRHFSGARPNVRVVMGGGIGEVPRELERNALLHRFAAVEGLVPRLMTCVDSDARFPGHPSDQAQAVAAKATELGVHAHVLEKRSIENYVPDDALRMFGEVRRERRKSVNAIISLDSLARDHYPMKDGLPAKEGKEWDDLYPQEFGVGLGLGNFMEDLLKNFSHTILETGLLARDPSRDLIVLLDRIEERA